MGNTPLINISLHTFRSPEFKGILEEAVQFFANTPVHLLPPPESFAGVGVYALYYMGDLPIYTAISQKNLSNEVLPIYVGKAVPAGWRTARQPRNVDERSLYLRLCEHSRSIQQTSDLQQSHFKCRFMVLGDVETDLLTSIEATLIRKYNPLWNSIIDGFGNHDPGSGRTDQAVSEWDMLHPGRAWAEKLRGAKPDLEAIKRKISAYVIKDA